MYWLAVEKLEQVTFKHLFQPQIFHDSISSIPSHNRHLTLSFCAKLRIYFLDMWEKNQALIVSGICFPSNTSGASQPLILQEPLLHPKPHNEII